MTTTQALQLVRSLIVETVDRPGLCAEEIALARATIELGLDSLHMMELAGALEDRLGRSISDNDLERVAVVADLVELVRRTAAGER